MRNIINGTKDYLTDCWHDFWYWFWNLWYDFSNKMCVKCYVWEKNEGYYTKEGSLRHYIQQRKIGSKGGNHV